MFTIYRLPTGAYSQQFMLKLKVPFYLDITYFHNSQNIIRKDSLITLYSRFFM